MGSISMDRKYHCQSITLYLFPKEASKTKRTAFVKVFGKQAEEHDEK
jgi:hypothetical protein